MSKVARIKTALLTALLWTLEVLGALALAGLLALLVYVLLLHLGLASERAASIAVSLWPAFVVAIFTVALWRSTQAQAEATRAMWELQKKLVSKEFLPFLGVRVMRGFVGEEEPSKERWWFEVSNLGKYGVLITGALWVESCSSNFISEQSLERVGAPSSFPLALPSGKTEKIFDEDLMRRLKDLLDEKEKGELGCFVLLLSDGSESVLRCYSAMGDVDSIFRLIIQIPDNMRGVFEEGAEIPQGDIVHEWVNRAVVLRERDCPPDLQKILSSVLDK